MKDRVQRYLKSTRAHRAIMLLTVVMVALAWTTYFLATREARLALENQAIHDAAVYANVLGEFRALYTSEVVAIVGKNANRSIHVSHQYREMEAAIPLPATLSMELGRRITAAGESRVSLYSPYPFPWRKDGGLQDNFEKTAWERLNANPEEPHYEFMSTEESRILRYAVADTLVAECVECHNTHPQTPRSGWKEGDVRGVLEVSIKVPRLTGKKALYSSWLITPGFLIAGIILFALFRRLTQSAAFLETEVHARTLELDERMRRYALLFATIPAGTVVMSGNGLCHIWNPAFEDMFDLPRASMIELHLQDLIHEEDQDAAKALLNTLHENPNEALRTELRFVQSAGNTLHGRAHARGLRDTEGALSEIFIMIEDVTAEKAAKQLALDHRDRLKREVMIQTAELRASNQELESFCSSVSHDLRTPLRALDGFSLALLEDCRDQLDEKGQDYLRRIRGGSQRMAVLIDQMLSLSRVGLMNLRNVPVDLSRQAEERVAELEAGSPDRVVTWNIAPDLQVNGDPHLLSLVLQNLLGNAWKYTRTTPDAHISFTREMRKGTPVFVIRDNGIGWDMTTTEDVFRPFNRAPSSAGFEGEGVGLATVARVIMRHGGHIQAESVPAKGATFFFTLAGTDLAPLSSPTPEENGDA